MIEVKLIAQTDKEPEDLISYSAKTCYTASMPKFGERINVENALFRTGHHTTLQHTFFSFELTNISVGAIYFGLHMTAPFYNTDQRSGRYSKMYNNPDLDGIKSYILEYYPNLESIDDVMEYIKMGLDIYAENIEEATENADKALREERPFVKDDYYKAQAPKVAQEKLRSFIPLISPTALVYTVNLSALAAYYRSAWSPEMRDVFKKMKDLVIEKHPNLSYMFEEHLMRDKDWSPKRDLSTITIKDGPEAKLIGYDIDEDSLNLDNISKDAVDTNYFDPEKMNNNINTVKTEVEVSLATMGDNHRHRMVKRTAPELTGGFYLAEILQEIPGLKEKAILFMEKFRDICDKVPDTLASSITPYGAMVKYKKLADINALQHEQAKRSCWCAQEEIHWVSVLVRQALEKEGFSKACEIFAPSCYSGKCVEGKRYCGRDLSTRGKPEFFHKRKA